jgi:hypothetical protein
VSRRGVLSLAMALLGVGFLAGAASAQPAAPLAATIYLANPPANMTFTAGTPIKLNLVLKNVTNPATPIITIDGFSATDFWRQLVFQLEGVGFITNASVDTKHSFIQFGSCHYRNSVIVPTIQVVPVEVLPGDFALQFTFDDLGTHFDLSRGGRYTVNARISFYAYDPGAVIDDCNVEFNGKSLLSIGSGNTVGRQQFDIVSNSLQFTILPADSTPPTTTATASPPANAAGWNSQDVTLSFSAGDDPGGSGVKNVVVNLFGAQGGSQVVAGASASALVSTEGITTAFYNAEDNAGNKEAPKSLTIRLDKTRPVVTPPASISLAATETGGARGSASASLAAFLAGGSATDNLDKAPVRLSPQVNGLNVDNTTLFPPGPTTVTFRFQDVAGNVGTTSASVTVTATTGKPAITATVVHSEFVNILVRSVDLKFTNSGTAAARGVVVQKFSFKTLAGLGIVFYDPLRGPKLPIALGDLAVGASKTIRVFLIAPVTIRKFSMTESGQLKDAAGATSSFSTTQTLSRPRDNDDFREDK